jgi:hypothetical protein
MGNPTVQNGSYFRLGPGPDCLIYGGESEIAAVKRGEHFDYF